MEIKTRTDEFTAPAQGSSKRDPPRVNTETRVSTQKENLGIYQ